MNEVNLGVFENKKIDTKGRIVIPSIFEPKEGDKLVLILCNDYLLVKEYNTVLKNLHDLKTKLGNATDIETIKFYEEEINSITSCITNVVESDKQGRITVVSSEIRERYSLGDYVTIEGVVEEFRIWNPNIFKDYRRKHIR
jgi:DNA-binding transcriptional regulator/RsmH inhibitor MraZ